ncbi:LuxR family transcriptional regulator [Amycolatopsis endophytica]|uniref:Putative ATPase/DNA-binding CsgD family transcriptional regulator n=2 Tax=Amycolatopsis endophytica TaxID=860233 RepID=A0A853BEB6_9PSEU|nr:putative ATPase/DNA-binding CsgD family transcriptional regulator [Amycolatopsis endophytica]
MGNLPSQTSSFIGRHRELGEVRRAMEAGRLLTLTGPGGVGKTRLAIQAAARARRAFPHGVWLVDLAALQEPAQLADTVATALGVKDQSARPAVEQIIDHLRDRRLLMVLDNCEHVTVACAALVDRVLRHAPGLRVLATSRQPLGITGERVLTIEPLAVPGAVDVPPTAVLAKYEGVALLVDRASAVRPGFVLDEENRETVARLCTRLDGLPLAIELAATRLRSLSAAQVADRLDDRFALLTRGNPAAVSRQQTLRALIGWSYDLCSEAERLLWARLSVFPAEFDLDAVEGICADDMPAHGPVVDLVDGLVAKSVVTARHEFPRARYRLLETIRQYGRERLAAAGTEAELRRRHRDYYLAAAERLCESWCGPGQAANLTELRVEMDNLTAALDWSLTEPGGDVAALRLVSALRYHWTVGGFLSTGRRRLDQALAQSRRQTPDRGHALWVAAWIAVLQGDPGSAHARLVEGARIAEVNDDDHLRAYVEMFRGTTALFEGDAGAGVARLCQGIELMKKLDDSAGVLLGLFQYSVALSLTGDHTRARSVCDEAMRISDRRQESWARSETLWARAMDLWIDGEAGGATADLVRQSLRATPNANYISTVLDIELLAWTAASRHEFEEAARLLGQAEGIWKSFGTTIEAFGPHFARYSAECRTSAAGSLGRARFEALFEEGRDRRLPGGPGNAPPSPVQGEPSRAVDLSRRERDVARLIAKGMTNKEIAAKLMLSPRTVDGHVERLFAKTGVSNRAQVVVWMAEHGTAHRRDDENP